MTRVVRRMRGAVRAAAAFVAFGALSVDGVSADSTGVALDSLRIVLEPGVVAADGTGLLPLRVVEPSGRGRPAASAALAVEIDGESTPFEIVDAPTALAVLLDPSAIPEAERVAWADEVARALASGAGGDPPPVVFVAGRRVSETVPTKEAIVAALEAAPPRARLYDGVVEAIGRLSTRAGLERHVLLVVASGVESQESRHPLVSCIGAADTARVAVHAIVVPATEGAPNGEARLRELAARTGGLARVASAAPGGVVNAATTRLRETETIRFGRLPGSGGRRSVRVQAPDAASATGVLSPRISLGLESDRTSVWIPLAAGVVLIAGAAWFVSHRTRSLGRLVIVTGAPPASVPITSHGVTLGGAKGNQLVFDDERISRNHAVVQVRGRDVTLVDLKSTNGTAVNGTRIVTKVLQTGDRILLAEAVELVYEEPGTSRKKGGAERAPRSRPANSTKPPGAPPGSSHDDDEDDP